MSQALTRLMMHTVNAVQVRKERGATMVEYGIMVALIAVVVMAAVGPLGTTIKGLFNDVTSELGGTPST